MHRLLAALVLLGAVSAQSSTASLWLIGFGQEALVGSVITSDSIATTYSLACSDPNAEDCGIPPGFRFTQGPSTIAYTINSIYNSPGQIDIGCVITSSTSGVCSETFLGSSATTPVSSVLTTSISGTDLAGQIVTLTAGPAAAASTASSTSGSTSTGSGSSKATGSASTEKSTASSTGAEQTAATPSSSAKTSTAGVPMFTGNAGWVVGGAAAALALVAL